MPKSNYRRPLESYPLQFKVVVENEGGTIWATKEARGDSTRGWTLVSTIVRFRQYLTTIRENPRHYLCPVVRGNIWHVKQDVTGEMARVYVTRRDEPLERGLRRGMPRWTKNSPKKG